MDFDVSLCYNKVIQMNISKSKIQTVTAILLVGFFFVPQAGQARGLVPCGGYGESPCNIYHIFYIIALVTNWLVVVAGLFATYQIVNAGFWMITTMGSEEKITTNKKMMTNAIVGMVMVMMAYLMVNTTVNIILSSKCKVNLSSPWDYVSKPCALKGNEKQINPAATEMQGEFK